MNSPTTQAASQAATDSPAAITSPAAAASAKDPHAPPYWMSPFLSPAETSAYLAGYAAGEQHGATTTRRYGRLAAFCWGVAITAVVMGAWLDGR